MADNKIKSCPDKLFALLAFTAIASLALIISGIVLFSFPTEMPEKHVVKQNFTIEYTLCNYSNENYDTCEEFFEQYTEQNDCQCFLITNLTEYLRGKVFVHTVLEIADQGSKIDNTSVKTFTDEIKSTSGQCELSDTQEATANEKCEVIPDSIFNDEFELHKYNLTTNQPDENGLKFNKTVRWSLDENNSRSGLQNKITVSMNSTEDLAAGAYLLYMPNFYRNENIGRRYLVFSTHEVIPFYHRSRVIEIIALAVGLTLAAASIALIVIWILGVKSNTLTPVPADEPTKNNRVSGTLPEERPLAAHSDSQRGPKSIIKVRLCLVTTSRDYGRINSSLCPSPECNLSLYQISSKSAAKMDQHTFAFIMLVWINLS